MSTKLGRKEWPTINGQVTGPDDWKCFGPVVTTDCEYAGCKLADFGCFKQDDTDSNKFVHAAVVQHKTAGQWAMYKCWGRTDRMEANDFQFILCGGEAEAQEEFEDYCRDKNQKRGVWATVGGIKMLTPKPKKNGGTEDLYVVRALTTRDRGLPDAKTIQINDGAKPAAAPKPSSSSSSPARQCDSRTERLLRDLNVATVEYTRGSLTGNALPTQRSIDEARALLTEAEKLVLKIGPDTKDQVNNGDLKAVTYQIYGRIPKAKPLGAHESTWILSQDNILRWRQDLDAFESALAGNVALSQPQSDPYGGMALDMEWIEPKSEVGQFINKWWPQATLNRHGWARGSMKILNAWRVERHDDRGKLEKVVDDLVQQKVQIDERPLFQERRPEIDQKTAKRFWETNTSLLFHGTRSVNVSGILRKSLLLPKQLVGVMITGAMFGPGLYFADDWKKSAGYTSLRGSIWSQGSGAVRGRSAFMFAAEVALGKPFVAPGPRGYTSPPSGAHCVFGKGDHYKTGNNSGVANNEWIVFRTEQARLRYLIEFDLAA